MEHRPRGLFRARRRAGPDAEAQAALRPEEVRHADQQLLQCVMLAAVRVEVVESVQCCINVKIYFLYFCPIYYYDFRLPNGFPLPLRGCVRTLPFIQYRVPSKVSHGNSSSLFCALLAIAIT